MYVPLMNDEINIILRDFNQDQDQAYIYASWRNSSFYSSDVTQKINPNVYFNRKTKQIKEILSKASIKIACFEDTPSVIVGYCVHTGTHLDFIYVKSDYRNKGVGTMLMPK